jgi:DNA-binding transcriptional LysR family regulator
MPQLAVDPQDGRTSSLSLESQVPPRVITLVWHRDRYRSPAARAFVDEAAGFCDELACELGLASHAETAAGA